MSKKQGKKFNVVDCLTEMEAVLKSKCDQAGAQLLADQLETLIKAMRAAEKQPSNRKSLALVAKMIQAAGERDISEKHCSGDDVTDDDPSSCTIPSIINNQISRTNLK